MKRGKTTVLTAAETRELLDSIDISTVVGLRDRALIAIMTFAFARSVRFWRCGSKIIIRRENGGGFAFMKKAASATRCRAHHSLEQYLDAYIKTAGIGDDARSPLFRSAYRRTGRLMTNRCVSGRVSHDQTPRGNL